MNIDATSILDAMDQYVFLKDRDSVYIYANAPFAKIAGLDSKTDIIGKTDYDLVWRDQAERMQMNDREVLLGTPTVRIKKSQARQDGSSHIMITKQPYRSNSEIIGVLGNFFDCDDHLILKTSGEFDQTKRRLHLKFVPEWLSESEVNVCFYLFHGFSAVQIATKMDLSEATIRFHIDNIKTKMQCTSKNQITEKAMETGIAWKIFTLYHSNGIKE